MSSFRAELRRVVCLVPLALALGCSAESSQLLVVIDTNLMTDVEPPVAGDGVLRSVRVEVCDESCDDPMSPRTERLWIVTRVADSARVAVPFSFGVAPFGDDPSRRVDIRVEARRRAELDGPDATLFAVRRRVDFVRGEVVRVPIFLSAQCIGIECPSGTTCNAVGECEPDDVVPSDDAGVARDGGPPPDAGPQDDCDVRPAPSPLPALELTEARDLGAGASGSSNALASGSEGSLLVAGRGGSSLFVRRLRADGAVAWETPIAHDATNLWFGQVRYLAERDGHVVAAGIIGEGWTIDGVTVPAPTAHPETDSRRHGVIVFSLDAATGSLEWVHVIKRQGVTHIAGGLVVDDGGIAVASYAIGSTVGTLELDGAAWPASTAPVRGVPGPHATLFRFGHDGTPRVVLGLSDDPPMMDVAIAPTGDGDVLLAFTSQDAEAAGLGLALPSGDLIAARLRPDDEAVWVRSIRCESGSWQIGSVKAAVAGARSWLAFSATSRDACGSMRVSAPDGSSMLFDRPDGSEDFIGVLALETCTGDPVAASIWSANAPSSPYIAVTSVDADERGLILGGALGHGGVDLGGGPRPGFDTGSGTDGFLLGLGVEGEHAFSYLFGGTAAGVGPDDGIEAVLLRGDVAYAVTGLSGAHTVGGVSVPAGAALLTLESR